METIPDYSLPCLAAALGSCCRPSLPSFPSVQGNFSVNTALAKTCNINRISLKRYPSYIQRCGGTRAGRDDQSVTPSNFEALLRSIFARTSAGRSKLASTSN